MLKFKAHICLNPRVEEIEIFHESKKFVWLDKEKMFKESKEGTYCKYFDTFFEARTYLIQDINERIKRLRDELTAHEKELKAVQSSRSKGDTEVLKRCKRKPFFTLRYYEDFTCKDEFITDNLFDERFKYLNMEYEGPHWSCEYGEATYSLDYKLSDIAFRGKGYLVDDGYTNRNYKSPLLNSPTYAECLHYFEEMLRLTKDHHYFFEGIRENKVKGGHRYYELIGGS